MRLRFPAILLILTLATGGLQGTRVLAAAGSSGEGKETKPGPATNAPVSVATAAQTTNNCLNCHGPFDKIISASTNYVAPSGEKTSPHRYVPHDSKKKEDIPDCTHCHTAHPLSPLPAKGSIDLSKVKVDWCYSCHHEKNFTSCKECHP